MIKKIALLAALAFVGYSLFTLGSIRTGSEFKVKLDSLNKVNDSLYTENKQDDSTIAELKVLDSSLVYKVEHQKAKIVKIKEVVVIKQNEIDTYDKHQLVNFYYVRYPKDTITNRIPVAQPVLVSAAKDLAAYDGAIKEITIKDSVIAIQESRITLKDSTIGLYINKEGRYRSIIGNKDQAIAEWSKQYDILNLNYKKLQVKSKFQKIGSYVIIGGLAYTLLVH
jgi:hypothetical protein